MFKNNLNINNVTEIRCKSTVYFGCGAINKINDIAEQLVAQGIKSVLIISGRRAYKSTGAWDVIEPALVSRNIKFEIYDKVTPNPSTAQIDEATALGKSISAAAVIAIGGGSPIDTAKSVAILLKDTQFNAAELYEMKFTPSGAVPIVAVNLTHGTGTEADRFAVATILEKEYKPAIAYDCIYPTWSIDDPALMTGLSKEQTGVLVNECLDLLVGHVGRCKTHLNAHALQCDGKEIDGAAVDGGHGDKVLTRTGDVKNGKQACGLTRGHKHCTNTALHIRDLCFHAS